MKWLRQEWNPADKTATSKCFRPDKGHSQKLRFPTIQVWLFSNKPSKHGQQSHIKQQSPSISPFHTHLRTHSAVSSDILCSAPVVLMGSLSKTPYHRLIFWVSDWPHISNQRWFQSPMWKLRHSKRITELLKGILLLAVFSFSDISQGVCTVLCLYGPFMVTEKYWGNFKSFYSNLWNSIIRSWEMSSCSKFYSFFLLDLNWNILIHLHESTALFPGYSFPTGRVLSWVKLN